MNFFTDKQGNQLAILASGKITLSKDMQTFPLAKIVDSRLIVESGDNDLCCVIFVVAERLNLVVVNNNRQVKPISFGKLEEINNFWSSSQFEYEKDSVVTNIEQQELKAEKGDYTYLYMDYGLAAIVGNPTPTDFKVINKSLPVISLAEANKIKKLSSEALRQAALLAIITLNGRISG